jgi:hypothetical protein
MSAAQAPTTEPATITSVITPIKHAPNKQRGEMPLLTCRMSGQQTSEPCTRKRYGLRLHRHGGDNAELAEAWPDRGGLKENLDRAP